MSVPEAILLDQKPPESSRVKEALEMLEFLRVIDVIQAPDSQYPDVVHIAIGRRSPPPRGGR